MVVDWFGSAKHANIVLPSGWVGRPYDEFVDLTWSTALDRTVLLEFRRQNVLVVTEPGRVIADAFELRIEECALVTYTLRGYGTPEWRALDAGAGTVRFLSPQAALRH
ncbi:MAG TPA: hypothetical protein VKV26_16445 [Dehalococcoidia bacterium]|nr:hypothetical protein [Dehalococcoidia bacterium]